jgi:flagellar hook assembly protein FlgD
LNYLWDGHDRAGRPLPAGVYSLSLTAKADNKAVYRAVRNLRRM